MAHNHRGLIHFFFPIDFGWGCEKHSLFPPGRGGMNPNVSMSEGRTTREIDSHLNALHKEDRHPPCESFPALVGINRRDSWSTKSQPRSSSPTGFSHLSRPRKLDCHEGLQAHSVILAGASESKSNRKCLNSAILNASSPQTIS